MFTIEYNTTRYCNSPLNSSLHTSIDSEIVLPRFNEMEKKIRLLYDNDGSKNSSLDYYIWEQGTKTTEYDF